MEYTVGDLVWTYYPLRRKGLSESLMHRWIGPYRILDRLRTNTYKLLRLSNGSTTTAHVIRLKPYGTHSKPQEDSDTSHHPATKAPLGNRDNITRNTTTPQ